MFQVKVDKNLEKYNEKTVKVLKLGDKMVAFDGDIAILELDCPEELNKSFDFIPEKRGYFKKDEMGDVYFTLIRYLDYHIHSEFSLLDGANKISNIVEKSEGCTAITDHGAMFGVLQFYKAMHKANKKPIIGIEAYCESSSGEKEEYHLVLLVKNEQGWRNICKIISEAEENFYYKPHVSWEMLEKYHEGLICTSACLGGEIPSKILSGQGDLDGAQQVVEEFKGIFGDDFYLEVQNHMIGTDEDVVNNAIFDIAYFTDTKVVAAMDSHYTNKEDSYAHEVLLAIGTKKKMADENRMVLTGDDYYLHSADEFEELFKPFGAEVISNTLEIVDKCDFKFDLGHTNMPKFPIPEGFSSNEEYFDHQCKKGFEERFKDDPRHDNPTYLERLKYEIQLIKATGFIGYFLIVQDYVMWAKRNGIYVGPGRGSCVGSLVCYCLGITDLDPIPYGLLFERFINPERISPPDIDVDFEDNKRHLVIEYIKEKYGSDHVSNIITFGTLAARNVIRDVGRVLDINSDLINKLAKSVPAEPKMTLAKAMKVSPDFRNLVTTDADAKRVVEIAEKLEGLSRNKGKHACFEENTLVTTSEGLKKIVDVKVGDKVLTCNNRFQPVVDLITTHTDKIYKIKTHGSLETIVTGNHPMYTRQRLEKSFNRRKAYSNEKVFKKVEDLEVNIDYIGKPINQNSIIPQGNLPFDNASFWWLIGRYLGDGWTEYPTHKNKTSVSHEKRVIICCDKKTEDEKNEIIKHINNVNFDYRIETANTTYKIFLKKEGLFDYLQNYGKGADGKFVYGDVLDLPIDLLTMFLNGYLSADGSYQNFSDRYVARSVSKKLILGIADVVAKVYHKACSFTVLKAHTDIIEGRVVNAKEKYSLSFCKDVRLKEHSFYEDGYIWSRVSSIEVEEKEMDMYNLTVLDDSSYVANGLGCHNCGVIISNQPIRDTVPEVLVQDKEDKTKKNRVAAFNMVELEELGLLKADFLGLRNMSILHDGIDSINSRLND